MNFSLDDLSWNPQEPQRAVARITIGDTEWVMDYHEWERAVDEERNIPVVFGEKLIFVDDETAADLEKLVEWIKNNVEQ